MVEVSCAQTFNDHCFRPEDVLMHNCSFSLYDLIRCIQSSGVARVELVRGPVPGVALKKIFHYNTLGAQEAFSWQFGLLTAYTGTA